jgi:hypothetical protein
MRRSMQGLAALVLMAGLAACGGGGATSAPADDGAAGATAPTTPLATTDAAASEGAAAEASVAAVELPSVPTGGGAGGDVCGLVTPDEMGSIFGVSGITQEVFAGPPDTCQYAYDNTGFVAMVLIPTGGRATWTAYSYEEGAVPISGLGDEALYSPTTELVIIRKGDAVVSIALFEPPNGGDKQDLLTQIGKIAAGRM